MKHLKPHTHTQFNIVFNSGIPKTISDNVSITPKIVKHQSVHLNQRKEMLEKYRHYVQQYTNACPKWNKDVLEYNAKVHAHIAQTKNKDYAAQVTQTFKASIGKVSTETYNHQARLRNLELAQPLITLKKFTPVRKSSEHVFSMIIFKYAMQIEEKNNILLSCGATTTRAIQKVQINHYELANTIIDEVFTLPYCKRTIHNHVNRLVESGILFDYQFKGREKPVEYHLNPRILTLFCKKNRKSLKSENQLFNYAYEKSLHNNEIDTRTYINNKEIIEPVNKQSRIKETETLSGVLSKIQLSKKDNNQNNNGNTPQRMQNMYDESKPGAVNFASKTALDIANYLNNAIEDRQHIIQKFSEGHYKNWRIYQKPPKTQLYLMVTMAHLEYEVDYGIMLKHDFFTILHQMLFKLCGTIYKKSNSNGIFNYAGPSYYGYKHLEKLLLNNNGTVPSKKVAFETFKALMWRIKFAANYFKSKPINPLFINDYLDPTRTTKKECGFAYTLEFYKNHKNIQQWKQKVDNSTQKSEKIKSRKHKMKAIELVEKQINKLKNGKITILQLHDYVSHNAHIPQIVKNKLPDYIKRAYSA
ncbi:hypothetical protein [Algibacter sp. PT7-4]|uniref:hypothetical protein n=1 Tax=Algibacter ulvanivorans TaxID=3400999 RepID=UPI003AAF37B0